MTHSLPSQNMSVYELSILVFWKGFLCAEKWCWCRLLSRRRARLLTSLLKKKYFYKKINTQFYDPVPVVPDQERIEKVVRGGETKGGATKNAKSNDCGGGSEGPSPLLYTPMYLILLLPVQGEPVLLQGQTGNEASQGLGPFPISITGTRLKSVPKCWLLNSSISDKDNL